MNCNARSGQRGSYSSPSSVTVKCDPALRTLRSWPFTQLLGYSYPAHVLFSDDETVLVSPAESVEGAGLEFDLVPNLNVGRPEAFGEADRGAFALGDCIMNSVPSIGFIAREKTTWAHCEYFATTRFLLVRDEDHIGHLAVLQLDDDAIPQRAEVLLRGNVSRRFPCDLS